MTPDERTALNREIATLMGWRVRWVGSPNSGYWVRSTGGIAPDFTASLDAQRDGPWKLLWAARYTLTIAAADDGAAARWWPEGEEPTEGVSADADGHVFGDTVAEACALASRDALRALAAAAPGGEA